MAKEIEVFEFLRAKYNIKGINMDDLKQLFLTVDENVSNKNYKNYVIKMLNTGSTLIYNTNNNTNTLLTCVKDYTESADIKRCTDCTQIKKLLNVDKDTMNCSHCYINYIDKIKNKEL